MIFGQVAQTQSNTPTRVNAASVASPLRLQETQLVNRNTAYLESRADAVQTINQTMGELGTVFSNLLELLEFQGSQVQRIDDNMGDIEDNVAAGLGQLQVTAESYSSKALIAKVFGILMVFMVMFIMFGA